MKAFLLIAALIFGSCVPQKTSSSGKAKKQGQGPETQAPVHNTLPSELASTCPTAASESEYCQIFTQKIGGANSGLDILWVIDNSGSMKNDQKRLAQNFETFINGFANQALRADFKMAIITTDNPTNRDSQGKLTSYELKSDPQNFIGLFKQKIKAGTSGSGTEQGLKMSLDFLKKYPHWPRQDAYLIAIYVSDEDDASRGGDAETYFKAIHAYKSSESLFKAFGIIPLGVQRYTKLIELSGGNPYNINNSFDGILRDFGQKIAKLASQFQLKYPALENSIEVYINGVLAPQGDWTYLPTEHAIRFEAGASPKTGSTIKVLYRTQ